MHRAFLPYTPVKDVHKIHRRKVHAARAVIDSCAPKVYQHLYIKLKKLQYEENKAAIIARDNRMLTNKMDHIMRTGGRTDHKNDYQSKSLNAAKHRRELIRVAKENRAILRRISEREPNYNHKKLLMDWQLSRQYLKNISKYTPPAWT